MTITASWDNEEHTLVRVIWTRRTSWDDWDKYQTQVVEMVSSVPHGVNFVHELHADLLLPTDWSRQTERIAKQPSAFLPNMGVQIFIGGNPMINWMLEMYRNTVGSRVEFPKLHQVLNEDEAKALVEKYEAYLASKKAVS